MSTHEIHADDMQPERRDVFAETGFVAREPYVSSRELEAEAAASAKTSATSEEDSESKEEIYSQTDTSSTTSEVTLNDVTPKLERKITAEEKERNKSGFVEARERLATIQPNKSRYQAHGSAILHTVSRRR